MPLVDKVILVDSFPSPTPDRIARFERDNRLSLPSDYIQFLGETNGGVPNQSASLDLLDSDGDPIYGVNLFYALDAGIEYFDLEGTCRLYWNTRDLSRRFLPVANDPFGNEYCMRVSRGDTSDVWFWFHETGKFDAKIADSFSNFRENIYCDPGAWRETEPVFCAIERGRLGDVRELLLSDDVHIDDVNTLGRGLLACAAFNSNAAVCGELLGFGADVNARDSREKTPLICTRSVDVVRVLLEAGADIEAASNDGSTPLISALKREEQRLAIELIQRGADIHAVNKNGESPTSLCQSRNSHVKPVLESRL